jgi:hypothetical protein
MRAEKCGICTWKFNRLARAMTLGVDRDFKGIAAGSPLPLKVAALAVGVRVAKAQQLLREAEFLDTLKAEDQAARAMEDPRNLALAIKIRDDPSAPGMLRLKAGLHRTRPTAG